MNLFEPALMRVESIANGFIIADFLILQANNSQVECLKNKIQVIWKNWNLIILAGNFFQIKA